MEFMFNRAEIVDQNFYEKIKTGKLPGCFDLQELESLKLSKEDAIDIFESQIMSRQLDLIARRLKNQNLCYYTIGSSGHEGNAVFGKLFRPTDMAFLHYRSAAFFIQRAKKVPGSTPLYDLLLSFVASSEDPISGGRHKVLGSKDLFIPPQTSTIASHLPKSVGAALSIPRARELNIEPIMPKDSVIICSFGDASVNHATALSAFNTASWIHHQKIPLPLIFICEDNKIGISVKTPRSWIKQNFSSKQDLKYINCDGRNIFSIYRASMQAERVARLYKSPVFLHMETVRLLGHAGSDVETSYHDLKTIESNEANDPLLFSAKILLELNYLSKNEILDMYKGVEVRLESIAKEVIQKPVLKTSSEVRKTIVANTGVKKSPEFPNDEIRKQHFQKEWKKMQSPQHMAKLINWGLTDLMLQYKNIVVFGEDVAKKGGVYHITDNLLSRFGPKRVFDSPLDETSIIGTGIGFSHNNILPVPEIQFLAYVHNAEDQIRGEAATLSFFSKGQFTNPMVLRVAGLAYQKGFGGHFHNDNSLSVFRDIPGLILAVPSTGKEAVQMLRTCTKEAYENGRVCIFVEPIALYMTKDLYTPGDGLWQFSYPENNDQVEIGEFLIFGQSDDYAIVTYGNGYYYSLQAVKELKNEQGLDVKVINLRWLTNIDQQKLFFELSRTKNILIVDECRKTGCLGEALLGQMYENNIGKKLKLLAADDCFIPLGRAARSGLPDKKKIIQKILEFQT